MTDKPQTTDLKLKDIEEQFKTNHSAGSTRNPSLMGTIDLNGIENSVEFLNSPLFKNDSKNCSQIKHFQNLQHELTPIKESTQSLIDFDVSYKKLNDKLNKNKSYKYHQSQKFFDFNSHHIEKLEGKCLYLDQNNQHTGNELYKEKDILNKSANSTCRENLKLFQKGFPKGSLLATEKHNQLETNSKGIQSALHKKFHHPNALLSNANSFKEKFQQHSALINKKSTIPNVKPVIHDWNCGNMSSLIINEEKEQKFKMVTNVNDDTAGICVSVEKKKKNPMHSKQLSLVDDRVIQMLWLENQKASSVILSDSTPAEQSRKGPTSKTKHKRVASQTATKDSSQSKSKLKHTITTGEETRAASKLTHKEVIQQHFPNNFTLASNLASKKLKKAKNNYGKPVVLISNVDDQKINSRPAEATKTFDKIPNCVKVEGNNHSKEKNNNLSGKTNFFQNKKFIPTDIKKRNKSVTNNYKDFEKEMERLQNLYQLFQLKINEVSEIKTINPNIIHQNILNLHQTFNGSIQLLKTFEH